MNKLYKVHSSIQFLIVLISVNIETFVGCMTDLIAVQQSVILNRKGESKPLDPIKAQKKNIEKSLTIPSKVCITHNRNYYKCS